MSNWSKIRTECFKLSDEYVYMNNSSFGAPLNSVNIKMGEIAQKFAQGMHGNRLLSEVIFKLSMITQKISETISPNDNKEGDTPLIGLVNSVTEGISLVANGINFSEKDTILITDHEHDGGETPWLLQSIRYNANVVKIPLFLDDNITQSWDNSIVDRFELYFKSNPVKLISIPYITTSTGHILPIDRICSLAKSYGVISVIDAAQAYGVIPINFNSLQCDVLVANCHKYLCGPIGTGFIALNNSFVDNFYPTIVDNHNISSKPYKKGGPSVYPSVFALEDALDHYLNLGVNVVHKRLQEIGKMLRDGLEKCSEHIQLITPHDNNQSCVMTCFRVNGVDSPQIDDKIASLGVHIKRSNEGNEDVLRISPHYYNTQEEFDKLAIAIGRSVGIPEENWPKFHFIS